MRVVLKHKNFGSTRNNLQKNPVTIRKINMSDICFVWIQCYFPTIWYLSFQNCPWILLNKRWNLPNLLIWTKVHRYRSSGIETRMTWERLFTVCLRKNSAILDFEIGLFVFFKLCCGVFRLFADDKGPWEAQYTWRLEGHLRGWYFCEGTYCGQSSRVTRWISSYSAPLFPGDAHRTVYKDKNTSFAPSSYKTGYFY